MPRKKKEPEINLEDIESLAEAPVEEREDLTELDLLDEEPEMEAEETTVAEESPAEAPKPKRARKPKVAAATATEGQPDPAMRQIELMREVSEQLCRNLERVSAELKQMPSQVADSFGELLRVPPAKPAPITKVAALVAGLALVLSILSLSFAQSARQSALNHSAGALATHQARDTRPVEEAPIRIAVEEPVAPPAANEPVAAPEIARAAPKPARQKAPARAKRRAARPHR